MKHLKLGQAVRTALTFLLLASVWIQHANAKTSSTPSEPVEFSVRTLDGKDYSARQQRGRYLLVNYWATWCKPCVKELPDFQALATRRSDIAVLGLAFEEIDDAPLKAFLKKLKISFPNAKVDVYAAPPVGKEPPKGLPMTYLYDPKGMLIKSFLGPITSKDVEKLLPAPAKP
jgi:thiol-disulfide isomerase/thioredoxin